MSFTTILTKIGLVAGQALPAVLGMFDQPLAAIVGTMLNSVLHAEAKIGSGNGEQKKLDALGSIEVAIPLILSLVKSATGKDLADADRLKAGIDKMNDAIVDILNAFRILQKA